MSKLPAMYLLPKPKKDKLITSAQFGIHISAAAILQEYKRMYLYLQENDGSAEDLKYLEALKMKWWWTTGSTQDVRDLYANLPTKPEKD